MRVWPISAVSNGDSDTNSRTNSGTDSGANSGTHPYCTVTDSRTNTYANTCTNPHHANCCRTFTYRAGDAFSGPCGREDNTNCNSHACRCIQREYSRVQLIKKL